VDEILFRFHATDRFSSRELWIELLGEDSLPGFHEARWTAFAMASAMGLDTDWLTFEGAEI